MMAETLYLPLFIFFNYFFKLLFPQYNFFFSTVQHGDLGGRGRSGVDWELGFDRCKPLPLGWISNEILVCSTGN